MPGMAPFFGHGFPLISAFALVMLGGMVVMAAVALGIIRSLTAPRRVPRRSPAPPPDPLEVARERYARGEIDHAEFERIAANLIKTEEKRRP